MMIGNWISKIVTVQQVAVLTLLMGALNGNAAIEGGAEERPLQIVLVGDSTMCEYDKKLPDRGWGMFLEEAFQPGSVEAHNLARKGRSTKTFIQEKLWDKALTLKPDYVFIQFGHNDSHDSKNPEATDAKTDYRDYLRRYIDDSREIGATPILITPMVRRTFHGDGTLDDNLKPYADAMKAVGREKDVPVIDLHASSWKFFEPLGPDQAQEYARNKKDPTHFNEQGARIIVGLVLRDLPAAAPHLARLLAGATSENKDRRADRFVVAGPESVAQLVVGSDEDEPVPTAIRLFANDVLALSGQKLSTETAPSTRNQIKIGTVGRNAGFDRECVANGIAVEKLKVKWETYALKVVQQEDGRQVLYVVGSDPRGTAYGLMELSRMIGISPWCWWADVRPEKKSVVTLPSDLMMADAPKVRFRGIFLNDEDWGLNPWAARTFEPETGDMGPKTYEKIFELLLRHKANAIWPAMHNCTRAFFTYPDNIKMAKTYGIWVGSSHCEPMLRNNVDEWHRWSPDEGERGSWNFDENPDQITEYWRQRVEETRNYDGIYTVGMRGIHDGSMPGGRTINDKLDILDDVLDTQRDLLSDILGKKASDIPQIFCPYKEVLSLYRSGAKIPDDVTIMWADDNHGYIRQLSNEDERGRSGGAGVYYHLSYWGRPHDYLWLESTPVALIWEEMHKAYETNAKRIWIGNVGDIKPNEISMSFFLEMAWDPEQFSPENLNAYYTRFAEAQFGAEYAAEIGEVIRRYFQLGFSRKPEHMGWNTIYPYTELQDPGFSLAEAQARIAAYDALERQVETLGKKLPASLQDAFFELVAYKVIGAANMNKKFLYAYLSRVYAGQGRIIANEYAKKAAEAFKRIKTVTAKYNDETAGGKWKHMMSYKPRNLAVFGMPETGLVDPDQAVSEDAVQEDQSIKDRGMITLEAEHYSHAEPSAHAQWKMIQGLGRQNDAMSSFPVTAPPFDPDRLAGAPCLTYDFYSEESGDADLYFYCLPNQPINAEYELRFAVKIDGGKLVVVNAALKNEMDENNPEWKTNVLRAATIPSCQLRIPGAGKHTLKLTMIDPGVVLDKIEIVTGTRKNSYFGAPETAEK